MTDVTAPGIYAAGEPTLLIAVSGQIKEMDRNTLIAATSVWVTPPLNRGEDPSANVTLRKFYIEYISDNAGGTLRLNFSVNGGVTYGSNYDITVIDTNGAVTTDRVAPGVTGGDLRCKFTFPTTASFRLVAYTPVFAERGNP